MKIPDNRKDSLTSIVEEIERTVRCPSCGGELMAAGVILTKLIIVQCPSCRIEAQARYEHIGDIPESWLSFWLRLEPLLQADLLQQFNASLMDTVGERDFSPIVRGVYISGVEVRGVGKERGTKKWRWV